MARIIIELTKYLTIILMTFYTFTAFRATIMKPGKARERRTRLMAALMYLIHGISYIALYAGTQSYQILILYGAQLLMLIVISALYKISYKRMSIPVFQNMLMLLMLGCLMITRLNFQNGVKQFTIITLSLCGCLIVPLIIDRTKHLRDLSWLYGFGGLLILLIVLFFGRVENGAKNWLVIAGVKFQPSEFVKLMFIFFAASALAKRHDFKRVVLVTLMAAAHVLVLVMEKDLGGAFIFFVTYLIMLYSATGQFAYLGSGIVAGIVASIVSYFAFSHVRVRVTAFLDPFAVIEHQGYQVAQSLFAIGTGGFSGMGLTQGLPTTIPVASSDFIFSAISEEMGAIVGICLILICLSCFIMFINISVKFTDPFYKITGLGLSTMYITQTFLNVGGAIKAIPSTGVTLPLVSYGGTSVLSSIFMFSIIQGMYVLHMRKQQTAQVEAQEAETSKKFYNRTIVGMTYVFSIMLFGVIGYYSYFVVFQGNTFINSSFNKRQELLAEYVTRGKILSSDGKILAQTIATEEGTEQRVYPFGSVFSHVVGRTLQGMTGLEQAESFTLLSCNENLITQTLNTLGAQKNEGDTVVSTLNAKLQQVAYDALGDYQGAVVAIEPSTGKILAMVSKPDYNPNAIVDNWTALNSDSSSPLLNRATQGLYPPGSTFKLITTLEYIRENPDYEAYDYTCTSEDTFHDVTIHCANNSVHGKENLKESFKNSCNTSFANIGNSLNLDSYYLLANSMLFNTSLPVSFKTAQSSFVLNSSSDPEEIPRTAIGLGKTLMSPLHNAMIAAAVANDGVLMKPYLVDHVETEQGSVVRSNSPSSYGELMTAKEASLLQEYMAEVVKSGTGTKLSGMKVSVAGKTGTAQYDTTKASHAWFIGFAPVENPQIAIAVIVETSGTGSKYAVPVAKQMIQAYFE